uniref:Ionotropic receptor 52b n=1 Tax=Drosophila melanogaster TaxID=7227 RepID=A1ZA15_DROME|nr:ionotropic receptor 52b [Drosophila melanogaster]AAM70972.2 ionotropic receptor 52b [Drosophila melanogaster]|eukprot:NP_725469.2 ionotropic receptor 52b [Drosophila melanogaster]
MTWLVILLCFLGYMAAHIADISVQNQSLMDNELINLLLKLRNEEFYDTLLVYGKDCEFHSVIKNVDVAVVLVSDSMNFEWNFSSLTLILSCGPDIDNGGPNSTSIKLQRNRRLVLLKEDFQPSNICNIYTQKEQYNIALVRENFTKSKSIYTCRYFQDPNVDEVNLSGTKPIFIEQFQNMKGKAIRIVPDLLPPRVMLYQDANDGELKMIGYVANLITNFAQKVNATLQLDFLKPSTSITEISRMAKDDELDMGITLEASLNTSNLETSSYPYLLTSYCLMVQVPAKFPYNLVYALIVDPLVLGIIFVLFLLLSVLLIYSQKMSWQDLSVANILLNDKSLRGLLGQSFPFPLNASKKLRLIFTILCFASIMLTTMYEAYLQSFFTNPPSEPEICSFQDVGSYNRRIAMSALEVNGLIKTNNSHFREIRMDDLEIFDNMPECYELRDAFNLSYNYVVTGDRWRSYAEQQTLFKEPVFYFARDLCFSRLIFLSVPLRRHLPYRHLFDEHMMQQHEFGFVNYWMSHSFFDMVRLGLTSLKDLSRPLAYTPSLLMDDISWIMKIYLAAIVLCVFCFLLEIGVDKWKRWMKFRNLQILNTC